MIVNNVKVYGIEDSIKASKYPMATDTERCTDEITDTVRKLGSAEAGSGHDQLLTGIIVQFDLTFTVKAWTEAERYHFFDFVSSQSTMHRITKFDLDKAYIEYVDPRIIEIMKEKVAVYNKEPTVEKYLEILYSNPCGFRLTARMTTNYRQLKTIYHQRKNHRLTEWKKFTEWIETLPCFRELCLGENMEIIEINKIIGESVKENGGYCPCMLVKTPDTKCPCKEFREAEKGAVCHCGRYRKEEK